MKDRKTKQGEEILSPLDDFVFTEVFGSQRNIGNTRGFLKALLDIPEEDYDKLTVENPVIGRFFKKDKMSIVDLKLSTKSGRVIHIELQVEKRSNLKNRITYYLSRLVAGQLRWGDDYKKLHQVISIVICNHRLLEEEKSYINQYELLNTCSGNSFTDMMKLVILELPKLPKEVDSDLWPWLRFFTCTKEEDYEMLARKHPELEKPVFCVKKVSLGEYWREYRFHKNLAKIDEQCLQEQIRMDSHAEGLAAGLAEGKAEEKLEIARKMKAGGDSTGKIHTITGLSLTDIEKL